MAVSAHMPPVKCLPDSPKKKGRMPRLLPQRPRTPLTVKSDLNDLCTAMSLSSQQEDDSCESQEPLSPMSRNSLCFDKIPEIGSPTSACSKVDDSPCSDRSCADSRCSNYARQPPATQTVGWDLCKLALAASRKPNDGTVVLTSKCGAAESSRQPTIQEIPTLSPTGHRRTLTNSSLPIGRRRTLTNSSLPTGRRRTLTSSNLQGSTQTRHGAKYLTAVDCTLTEKPRGGRRRACRGASMPVPKTSSQQPSDTPRHVGRLTTTFDVLVKYSMDMRLPIDLLKQASELFLEHAEPPGRRHGLSETSSSHTLLEGKLGQDGFNQILCMLSGTEDPKELPTSLVYSYFSAADADNNHSLDFSEFALWFSRFGFSEIVLVSKQERELRGLARKHNLTVLQVEAYKSSFDAFDEDGSGGIELDEFEKLLRTLIKIPEHLEIPANRVRQFWADVDMDKSGSVSFEEFLVFYLKYFVGSRSSEPIEEFYWSVRPSPNLKRRTAW